MYCVTHTWLTHVHTVFMSRLNNEVIKALEQRQL